MHKNNTMAILLKTASVRVSSIQIMQVRVQNKGKSVWKVETTETYHTPSCWRSSPSTLSWIESSWDVTEPNVCRSRRCRTFGTRIGRIMKTYDYINRVVITLPLSVYEGAWTTLPPLVAMHHLDGSCVCVGIFLKLMRSPTVVSESGLCVDVICTSRTQRVVSDNSHIAYQHVILWFGGIVGWSGSDRHYAYAYV